MVSSSTIRIADIGGPRDNPSTQQFLRKRGPSIQIFVRPSFVVNKPHHAGARRSAANRHIGIEYWGGSIASLASGANDYGAFPRLAADRVWRLRTEGAACCSRHAHGLPPAGGPTEDLGRELGAKPESLSVRLRRWPALGFVRDPTRWP